MSAAHAHQELHELIDRLSPDQARRMLTLVNSDPALVASAEGTMGADRATKHDETAFQPLALIGSCEGGPVDLAEHAEDYLEKHFNHSV